MAYTLKEAYSFIEKIAPIIQREAVQRGYHTCAAVIAQAVIEGACGTSELAKRYNNHFGLKCGAAWIKAGKPAANLKTKEEYVPGTLLTINDYFRVYSSMEECVKGYYEFISTARYSNLKTASDYKTYANFLKNDGYATSSKYVKTLCDTVVKYGLDQYDRGYLPTLKKGSQGAYVKELQSLLNYHKVNGGMLTIDGIFGVLTYNAVIDFQARHNLVKDGIVGRKTWSKLYE